MRRHSLPGERRRLLRAAALLLIAATAPVGAQKPDSVRARLKPNYGSGLVWVEPLPMTPRELASLLSGTSERSLKDSAIVALTQRFLDAMATEQRAREAAGKPVSWTTELGGQTVGLDGKWIHLGPVKLPAALLALLPINTMANPTEVAAARKRNAMREDILTAGWRQANLADLKRAVRQLREERERDREFERNRRTPPPDSGGTP